MAFLIVIALLVLSCWGVFTTFRRLRRTHASRTWWFAFGASAAIGLFVGCWLAFGFEYQVSPRMRSVSFPMPLSFFHLEDGQWIDFVTPPYVMYPGLIANITAIVAAMLLPLLLASLALGKRHRDNETHTA